MKKFFIISLLIASQTLFAQTGQEKQDKVLIGINFSPDIYYNTTAIFTDNYMGYHMEPISSGMDFTTGIAAEFKLIPKLSVGTGVAYSKKDYSGTFICYVCDFIGNPEPQIIEQRFVEIPLFFRYYFLDKKFDIHLDAGLNNAFFINSGPIVPVNKYLLSGQFGLGINLDVGKRINLDWTAVYRHSLNDLYKNNNFMVTSMSYIAGISYRIKS